VTDSGQIAYNAFAAALDWRNHQGGCLPFWDALSERDRDAFRQAARAVLAECWGEKPSRAGKHVRK
jgi:hypothetical protein